MNTIHQELLTRPTVVQIDMASLRHNFKTIKSLLPHSKILCIVKGNAYGHGAVAVARCLEDLNADYLGVALPEEGVELRQAGITLPILVLSAIAEQQIKLCIEHNLTLTAPSDDRVRMINHIAQQLNTTARIHINIDTGMSRIGVHYTRVEKFFPALRESPYVHLEGIYSHFSSSDEETEHNGIQLERFLGACEKFNNAGFNCGIKHMANSAATLSHKESHLEMVRVGLSLYGYYINQSLAEKNFLKPILSWKTKVSYFKSLARGTGIGYSQSYVTTEDTRIATLTVGYADGYQKAMGEGGSVIIRDRRYPIVGNICMDQMMIDLGINGEAYVDDEVLLVGSSQSHCISLYDLADLSGTSVYEVLCRISYRVRREYMDTDK